MPSESIDAEPVWPDMVVVGELNVDLILDQVNALPELEKERLARGMTLTLGSSSAIFAANASAMGLRTGFVGRIGSDAFGRYVLDRMQARGIDTQYVLETPDVATGLTVVYTFQKSRGAITFPGAMEWLVFEDMPWNYIEGARHLHLSSYYLQPGLRPQCPDLFRRAKELKLTTSFDTNWDPAEQWGDEIFDVLDNVDVFLPNDDEARLIAGTNDLDQAMEVLAQHAGTVVVTCGGEGVRAQQGRRVISLPAIPVNPVDAVGAGDSFNAGFLSRYVRGAALEDCLRHGLAAGAFSTLRSGGTAAFDDPGSFRAFVAEVLRSQPADNTLLSA